MQVNRQLSTAWVLATGTTYPRRGMRVFARLWNINRRWPLIPIFILLVMITSAIFAPWVAPKDPIKATISENLTPPFWDSEGSSKYILGADDVGRDILSRIIWGARVSMAVAAIATVSGMFFGVSVGIISGWYGGMLDEVIQRIVEVWLAIPFIMFALVVIIMFGASVEIMLILMITLAWSAFVRNIRAEVLLLRETDYVASARVSGASNFRIMFRHIAPGVLNTAVVIATLRIGQLILAEASLSFLGAGIPDPTPAWGVMVADGRDFLGTAWWVSFFPGVAIFLVVMSFNFLGDWLRDRLDPRLRQI